ncbi:solute carrier family 35 member F5-like isoform X2 [Petromyzon marinus]|uniref:Solute carrier family 35 member F5 n=1 Tax=Petromyzon marinus TaxID=7757 RepID=A0AAJ7TDU6_PETMA|nr:solute carrier family 35 member F5-like isoform X2 [Petromyzon marinus]
MDSGQAGPRQTRRRMLLGIGVLLLVDFIWVASSELTSYIYTEFNKPFFSTFVKTSLFSLYLLGFVLWPPWRRACAQGCPAQSREPLYVPVEDNEEDDTTGERPSGCAAGPAECAATPVECRTPLLQDSVSAEGSPPCNRKLSVAQVAKLSFSFCFVWFLANFSYQQALAFTHVAIVNIISSTSGLFTLVLAALLPSSSNDRFSLSKLLAVLLSIGGVLLVSLSTVASSSAEAVMAGCIWSLLGALLYATYLVLLQRSAGGDRQLDIPMFFGFVGLFNLLCLWPGFPLLHYAGFETFVFPSNTVWAYILINGLVGTVLSEFLWLWGCFLTTSLMGTLALSLTIPLSIVADIFTQKASFSWLFFLGAMPIFLSFSGTALLTHYSDWDPVGALAMKGAALLCPRRQRRRSPEDIAQTSRLIPEE